MHLQVILAAILALCFTSVGRVNGSNAVVELTDSNFENLVYNSEDIWLVEFFAPWCVYCKNLAPHWDTAASELEGKVKLGTVDATVHHKIAGEFNITDYPTIKFFLPGSEATSDAQEYDGNRTSEGIVSWALSKQAQIEEGRGLNVSTTFEPFPTFRPSPTWFKDDNETTTTTTTARIFITTKHPPEYHFNLRECVRTVAKIELLEDYYDALDLNFGRLASNLAHLIFGPEGISSCRWPVYYIECLGNKVFQSGVSYFAFRIWETIYALLTTLQAMFVGIVRCFVRHYY